jgi:hypothetical protein
MSSAQLLARDYILDVVGFVTVAGATKKTAVFWVPLPCSLKCAEAEVSPLPVFAGLLLGLLFHLIMEAIFSSETSGFLRSTRHYNSEDCFLQDIQKHSFPFILYSCVT